MTQPLLEIRDLAVAFRRNGEWTTAVDRANLSVLPGETVAIVGESGSGKSTTAHSIVGLLPGSGRITGGQILFDGRDLAQLRGSALESVRGRQIGFVPQDPMSNLNPVWSIGFQVRETIRANGIASTRDEVRRASIDVLERAGLHDAENRLHQFPHQFSGGMRQRVLIGLGLSGHPRLLIADEPTSALDVTVQKTVLDHLQTLTRRDRTALLLITHDLGLAAERAESVVVMYRGQVVESGPAHEVLANPVHPYTQRLVAAAPSIASRRIQRGSTPSAESLQPSAVAPVDLISIAERKASAAGAAEEPLIRFQSVTKRFPVRSNGRSTVFTAVDDASFEVRKGSTMALVGESGSGKSTAARMLLRLEVPDAGTITIGGRDIAAARGRELVALRSRMQPVFQDPYGSLDPLASIGATIAEPLNVHHVGSRASRRARVREILDQVALPSGVIDRFPNELSGGQRQRVAIARALALRPEIVVLDEAVSALDVLVQAQILDLLAELQSELGLTCLFITHDLAVVRVIADDVSVMRAGRIIESAPTDDIFANPRTDYTRALLDAIPGAGIPIS